MAQGGLKASPGARGPARQRKQVRVALAKASMEARRASESAESGAAQRRNRKCDGAAARRGAARRSGAGLLPPRLEEARPTE